MHQVAGMSANSKMKWVFLINLIFTIAEFIGGGIINSVAIMSDAVHDLGDTIAIGLAWYLGHYALKKADEKYPFGYRRYSLLAAMINSLVLILGSVLIMMEVVQRLLKPEMPEVEGMFWFAIFGVLFNGLGAWLLRGGNSLNEQVLSWHLVEDILGWIAVLIVSIVLRFYELPILDPLLSILILGIVLFGVTKRFRQSILVFLQRSPGNFTSEEIADLLNKWEGNARLDEVKEWSLDGEYSILDIHVKMPKETPVEQLLNLRSYFKEVLKDRKLTEIHVEVVDEDE